MRLVRVFTKLDGSVAIMHPNPALRLPNESETDFVSRVCGADVAKIPALAGLPFADVEHASLPVRKQVEDDGTVTNLRDAWKVANKVVSLDDSKLAARGVILKEKL